MISRELETDGLDLFIDEYGRLINISREGQTVAGRPVIAGTGLATQVIFERYKAGESVRELAYDYERSDAEIEEAIRCEALAA